MLRYTVTKAKPTGREYHGPGNPRSKHGLSLYHLSNSPKGLAYADESGHQRADIDVQHTADGVPVVTHSIDAMGKEGFAAPGVPHRGIDRLAWPLVKRLRTPDGTAIEHLRWMLKDFARRDMTAAIDLKGKWSVARVEQVIRIANETGAKIYVKCDRTKPHLMWARRQFRLRGVWVRSNGSSKLLPPL